MFGGPGAGERPQNVAPGMLPPGYSAWTTPGRTLDAKDRATVANVPQAVADGLACLAWWRASQASGSFAERFPLVRTFNPADAGFGFFGTVPLPSGPLPVMGAYQEMPFDLPKTASPLVFREQLREFVLHYFLRLASSRLPEAFVPEQQVSEQAPLPGLSWCPDPAPARSGFGFSQLYYQLRDSGEIGKFPELLRPRIVDQRQLGTVYDWLVANVDIFDFNLDFSPLGPGYPYLRLPMAEQTLVVFVPEMTTNLDDPEPGVLGDYGVGYALLRDPTQGVLAYGPGQFSAGFQLIDFKIDDRGQVKVCMVFVVNRPERILNITLNPLLWGLEAADVLSLGVASRLFAPLKQAVRSLTPGFPSAPDPIFTFIAMANALTGGRAAQDFCISRADLEKNMLVQHFMQHYTLITGALNTWRGVADWTEEGSLPGWVVTGRSGRV